MEPNESLNSDVQNKKIIELEKYNLQLQERIQKMENLSNIWLHTKKEQDEHINKIKYIYKDLENIKKYLRELYNDTQYSVKYINKTLEKDNLEKNNQELIKENNELHMRIRELEKENRELKKLFS